MDVTSLLDPEIAALLASGPILGPVTADTLTVRRAAMLEMATSYERSPAIDRTDHVVESPDGHRFAVRTHRARDTQGVRPAVVWMHGGGLVAGTHLADDGRFDKWCQRYGVVGVAVDYGLAPERPYPGPVEDCYAALRWTLEHADQLGIDPSRIGIGGSSAGGNQAAGLALLARDRGEVPVAFCALIYPMLDDRMITPSSQWEVPIWPPISNDFGWNAYLEGRRGAEDVPIYAAPARAGDLAGLPPTYICVGALDGFLDEDVDYAQRLARAGVPVELHVYPGAPHGFDLMTAGTEIAGRARRHLDEWLAARVA